MQILFTFVGQPRQLESGQPPTMQSMDFMPRHMSI